MASLARSITTGKVRPSPPATASARRAIAAFDFGPGIAVTTRRTCSRFVSVVMGKVYDQISNPRPRR